MSLKDWMPDKTFVIGSIAVSVVLGYIGEVPWWTMWLFWFVGFPFIRFCPEKPRPSGRGGKERSR